MVSLFGPMADPIRETGSTENNMVKESILQVRALRNMENGKKEKG